jgi:hypothetical protein
LIGYGSLLDKTDFTDSMKLGGYTFIVRHDHTLGWSPKEGGGVPVTGIILLFFINILVVYSSDLIIHYPQHRFALQIFL